MYHSDLVVVVVFCQGFSKFENDRLVLNSDGEKDMIVTKYVPDNIEGLCAGDGVIGANYVPQCTNTGPKPSVPAASPTSSTDVPIKKKKLKIFKERNHMPPKL